MPRSLNVNLNDPDDVRRKLPRARERLAEMKDDVANFGTLVETLENIAARAERVEASGGSRPSRAQKSNPFRNVALSNNKRAPTRDLALAVVKEAGRPMRSAEVAKLMGSNRNAINRVLWGAANANLLKKVGDGLYAPLDYEGEPSLLAGGRNGSGDASDS